MSKASKVLDISRHQICRRFQLNGFNLKSDAISLMLSQLLNGYPPYASVEQFIKEISHVLMLKCKTNSFIIDANAAQMAIDHLVKSRVGRNEEEDSRLVVKNVLCEEEGEKIANNYLNHYQSLFKNLEKHAIFKKEYKLTQIDSLMTCATSMDCIMLAFIRRDLSKVANNFILEDPTGKVPIEISDETQWRDLLIVENSFVLIEGSYEAAEDVLCINAIGMPPPMLDNDDHETNAIKRVGKMIIVLYDVLIDDAKTIDKLKILLTGYNASQPIPDCFIFAGKFVQDECSDQELKVHMKNLVKLISAFSNIAKNSQLIFVPDVNEKENIPKSPFTQDMFPTSTCKISNFYLATNPVNIYVDSRHVCLFAYPYISKLKKSILHDGTESESEFGASIGKLMLSNAHLTGGLNRTFSSSLSLWHVPDLLLLADPTCHKDLDCNLYNRTTFNNLPSFSRDQFKFKVYYTQTNTIEDSQILM